MQLEKALTVRVWGSDLSALPDDWHEEAFEHARRSVSQGYTSGELVFEDARGWWTLTEQPADAFNWLEIHPVVEWEGGTCEQYDSKAEANAAAAKPDNPGLGEVTNQFWSIYGHTTGRGLDCIGDFETLEGAMEIAKRIAGDRLEVKAFE